MGVIWACKMADARKCIGHFWQSGCYAINNESQPESLQKRFGQVTEYRRCSRPAR